MRVRQQLANSVVVLIATSVVPCLAQTNDDLRSKVDRLATPLIKNKQAVGFVVGVIQGDQTLTIAYGETSLGSGQAPTGDTIYEIGSVSKAFTGSLLADMVERKLVQLDDPIQYYLPEAIKAPIAKEGRAITLVDLATHTSGLPRLPANISSLLPTDAKNPYARYTDTQMYSFLNNHTLRRPPGEYEYSNYGMGLLGALLARKASVSYEELLIDRIAKPLEMYDTRITLTEGMKARLAFPYDAALKPNYNWDIPALAGAGAIRSTVNDLLKFAHANLREDANPLSRALALSHRKQRDLKDGQHIGLGWHLSADGATIWHNGMTGGYSAWLAVVPSKKAAVVVLTNVATPKSTELGQQLTRIASGEEVTPPADRTAVAVDADILKTYVGKYALNSWFHLTVTLENDQLMVQATLQAKYPIFAETQTKFFYKVVDAQITFVPDSAGKVTKLILHQNGRNTEGARTE